MKQNKGDNMTLYEIDSAILDCVDVETGEIFDSTSQAGEVYNVTRGMITQCCQGKRKTVKGKKDYRYNLALTEL